MGLAPLAAGAAVELAAPKLSIKEVDRGESLRVSSHTLNEDPRPTDGDEIYASVRLVNSAGKTVRSRKTNRIRRYFDHI